MRRALIVSLSVLAGYAIGAAGGYWAVVYWSPNQHDPSLEAVMTAFFGAGPAGAALGAITGFIVTGRAGRPR